VAREDFGMATDVTGTCADCLFARANESDADTVFCHRNAPRPDSKPGWGIWPKVHAHEWCGDFKNRKWKRPPDGM
jgi:hypothetical protein